MHRFPSHQSSSSSSSPQPSTPSPPSTDRHQQQHLHHQRQLESRPTPPDTEAATVCVAAAAAAVVVTSPSSAAANVGRIRYARFRPRLDDVVVQKKVCLLISRARTFRPLARPFPFPLVLLRSRLCSVCGFRCGMEYTIAAARQPSYICCVLSSLYCCHRRRRRSRLRNSIAKRQRNEQCPVLTADGQFFDRKCQ